MMRLGTRPARNPQQRNVGQLRVPMLAGWLFADLFLVLFMIALSAQPSVSQTAHVRPGHHPTPVAAKPQQRALERAPADFWIYVNPAGLSNDAPGSRTASLLIRDFNTELASLHLQGRQAGFVLVFATGQVGAINDALQEANNAIQIIQEHDAATFGHVSGEGLWGGQGSGQEGIHSGQAGFHFQIFFFA
jgi:hypothetical protein